MTKTTTTRQVKHAATRAGSPIDDYLGQAPPAARSILKRIRALVREEVPEAEERISYRMPAFFHGGAIIYVAVFTHHVGIFPPVTGGEALEKALSKYRGEKGNLRFPLDEPIPYPLIRRVVRARMKTLRARKNTRKRARH